MWVLWKPIENTSDDDVIHVKVLVIFIKTNFVSKFDVQCKICYCLSIWFCTFWRTFRSYFLFIFSLFFHSVFIDIFVFFHPWKPLFKLIRGV